MKDAPAIVVLTAGALATAQRAAAAVDGEIHGLARRVDGAPVSFERVAPHLQQLFRDGRPIVGLCAAGVLIRALAADLSDKTNEPPVLAVAEDGSAVIPLLGGHHGGNRLARRIAAALGVEAAITTASDLRFDIALDEPPDGYTLVNPEDLKDFTAKLLAGGRVRLVGRAPWLYDGGLPLDDEGTLTIGVDEQVAAAGPDTLHYHPRTLAVGVGCERGAEPSEVLDLVGSCLDDAGLDRSAVALVTSLDLKMDEPAVNALAAGLGVPSRFFPAARLEDETPRLANPSELVFREVGCHGVAEGAALAAVGEGGQLLVAKRKSARATCAIARAPAPLAATEIGIGRGRLAVVGIGPGRADWRTPEAGELIASAEDVVGYGLYLDLLGPGPADQRRHAFDLGAETERVRAALELAAEGRRVALVSSGDAGIYAMATLVFELLDREGREDWRRLEVVVAPGISALQAVAARAGAPLGHDFCTISLSDLLTPWPVIEKRIEAAARGDFVIAFYNPASRQRTTQLARAMELLGRHRGPDTVVVLGRNMGRGGEDLRITDLAHFDPCTVDMLTLVMIGATETRALRRTDGGTWAYTPRGYGTGDKG
ncbi:MAG: precorrin-3B C(17)-methyltransferase [Alphaproteobacteria bacterium]|nr:precorrin-3B C(17)-methyltransferase [Alphaproteobacteria bacterium]